MRRIAYRLTLLATALAFAACGGDDESAPAPNPDGDNPGNNGSPTETPLPEGSVRMEVSVLTNSDELAYPTPRMVITREGMMTAEINDPKQPEKLMLQIISKDADADALVMVSRHNIILAHYNPLTDKALPQEVLLAGDFDGFSTLSLCDMNWDTGDVRFLETLQLSGEGKPLMAPATRGENDAIKKPFFDMVDYIGEEIGKISERMEKLGKPGKAGKAVCTAWSEVVLPLMRYNLYADDEIAQQKYVEEYIEGKSKKLFCTITGIDEDALNFALWAYNNAHRIKIGNGEYDPAVHTEKYSAQGKQQVQQVAQVVNQSAAVLNATIRRNQGVEVAVEVTDISENSVSLRGAVKFDDSSYASYISAGYCYYSGSQEVRVSTSVTKDFQITPGTIQKLEPATKYAVAAYYEPMVSAHQFYSPFVDVVTRGILFTPARESIAFESDGGTAEIPIKTGYKTTWKVAQAPSWCTCTKQEGKLFVKAQQTESENDREGHIVLTASGYYGDAATCQIRVFQKGKEGEGGEDENLGSWADTKWQLSGTMVVAGETFGDTFILDLTEGTIRFLGEGETAEFYDAAKLSAFSVSGNNLAVTLRLVIYDNLGRTVTDTFDYKFHRDGNSITCTMEGIEENFDNQTTSVSGRYTGTRIQ
ncbi:MAG: BACON domain-containing protein [Bacteroidaceae bacterium]|nr:BACON domain-containing protein [Bacteroidaceae bacterium]